MSKHTPGPWRWGDNHRGLYGQGEGRQREVLTFEPYEGMWLSYTDHQDANARLIAAAPTLLDSLESLVMAIELPGEHCEVEQAIREARAALQAAKGGKDA